MLWWKFREAEPLELVGGCFWHDVFMPGDHETDDEWKEMMLRKYYPKRYWLLHGNGD